MPVRPPAHKPLRARTKPRRIESQSWGQGRGGRAWRVKRKRVFERDGYLCQICVSTGKLTPVTLHGTHHGVCDHIVPVAAGGAESDDNLQTICQSCDKRKTHRESRTGAQGGYRRAGGGAKV